MEATDWIIAGASSASALFAAALFAVTVAYVKATKEIADANDRMADANVRLLEEMRLDREVAANQASVQAAQRLTVALSEVRGEIFREPRAGQPLTVSDQFTRAWHVWARAYHDDGGALRPAALRHDLARFTELLQTPAFDWEHIIDFVKQSGFKHAPPRSKFNWAASLLTESLMTHRRGEDVPDARLPSSAHAMTFWELPQGVGSTVWRRLADEHFDPSSYLVPKDADK